MTTMNAPTVLDDPRPVRLTVQAFSVLSDAGAFDRHGRVELVEGAIVELSPQLRTHSFPKNEIAYRLRRALETLGAPLAVQVEVTLEIPPHNALEPDIIVTDAPRGMGYMPVASAALVVEIADSSLRWDLEEKRRLYAAGEVPEYWVVDVTRGKLHRFWGPSGSDYENKDEVQFAGELRSATMPELAIDGSGIL